MPFNTKFTTIQIRPETREALKAIGSKSEVYDDIIGRLLKKAK